jgi:uncharacterized membrane protein
MIPTSYLIEAVWRTVAGLLLGLLWGGIGVGLLVRAVWLWRTGRTRVLRTSNGTSLTVLKELGPAPREGSRQLEPADGQSG